MCFQAFSSFVFMSVNKFHMCEHNALVCECVIWVTHDYLTLFEGMSLVRLQKCIVHTSRYKAMRRTSYFVSLSCAVHFQRCY